MVQEINARNHTTRVLRAIAYGWLTFPLSYSVYSVTVLALNLHGLVKLFLSPGFWLISAVSMAAGYGVITIRWFGWYLFLASNFLITYEVASDLANNSVGDVKTIVFFVTVALQLLVIYLVAREVRVPYFFPRIRWWESDPRYKLRVQVKLTREGQPELEGEIMDLSQSGCFVKTHSYFNFEESIKLDFMLFERAIRCGGRVVWRTESTVTHPKGIGVKFELLDRDTVFCLREGTLQLKKLARVYTQMTRERNWQEYVQREQRYQGRIETSAKKEDTGGGDKGGAPT